MGCQSVLLSAWREKAFLRKDGRGMAIVWVKSMRV